MPGKQRQFQGVEDVLYPLDLDRPTLDHDAPRLAGISVVAVDFEGDGLAEHGGGELGAFGGPKYDGSVVDDEVHRKDVGVVADRYRKAADFG